MTALAIETGIEPEYENALMDAAKRHGWEVLRVVHVPFGGGFVWEKSNTAVPSDVLRRTDVWLHGSIQAAKGAQTATSWKVHAPWNDLRCSSYYPLLRDFLFQREWFFTTLESLKAEHRDIFRSSVVQDRSIFVRPDGNDKVFTGGCVSEDGFEESYKLMTFYEPPPNTVVVVARPQKILAEARFLVVDRKVVTGSYYRTGGQTVRLEAGGQLTVKAEEMLQNCLANGFDPAPSWVLDLADDGNEWRIIEVGASSCCGLYKCDLDKFVAALGQTL